MSDVKSATLDAMNQVMAGIAANTDGAGAGWLPDDGDHHSFCVGVTEEVTEWRSSTEPNIPGKQYTFHFKRLPTEANRLAAPEPFSGTRMTIPDSVPTSEKGMTKFRLDAERLMGHFKTLLGSQFVPGSVPDNLKRLRAKLDTMKAIPVLVRVTSKRNTSGGRDFPKEWLTRNLEATTT